MDLKTSESSMNHVAMKTGGLSMVHHPLLGVLLIHAKRSIPVVEGHQPPREAKLWAKPPKGEAQPMITMARSKEEKEPVSGWSVTLRTFPYFFFRFMKAS